MSRYATTPRPSPKPGGSSWLFVILAVGALGAAGYFGYRYIGNSNARATDSETGCLTNVASPQAVLFLVDETDRLSAENAARIGSRIRDEVERLPRYSRVIIVPFGGDTATPLLPIFNACVPGRASTARLDEGSQLLEEQYQAFGRSIDTMVRRLREIPDSRTSPITEQVIRAASDSQLHWQGQERSLVLITDGLETSIYWTRSLRLPDPQDALLRGVRAEFFEIGNQRGSRFQTRQMRLEWKSWLERAGANVRMTAPGFAANP